MTNRVRLVLAYVHVAWTAFISCLLPFLANACCLTVGKIGPDRISGKSGGLLMRADFQKISAGDQQSGHRGEGGRPQAAANVAFRLGLSTGLEKNAGDQLKSWIGGIVRVFPPIHSFS